MYRDSSEDISNTYIYISNYPHKYVHVHGLAIHIFPKLCLVEGSKTVTPSRNKLSTVQILVSKCHWKPALTISNLWKDADSSAGREYIEKMICWNNSGKERRNGDAQKLKGRCRSKDIQSQTWKHSSQQPSWKDLYILQILHKEISMNPY